MSWNEWEDLASSASVCDYRPAPGEPAQFRHSLAKKGRRVAPKNAPSRRGGRFSVPGPAAYWERMPGYSPVHSGAGFVIRAALFHP
jgi:hypothetical protein